MEQPKREKVRENIKPIDKIAKSGKFEKGDLPGTDTYDDGMNEKGQIVMPGSTSTGSGSNYMEDTGPNDLRHRNETDEVRAQEDGLTVAEPEELSAEDNLYAGDDAAAQWLRKNDPNYGRRNKHDKV